MGLLCPSTPDQGLGKPTLYRLFLGYENFFRSRNFLWILPVFRTVDKISGFSSILIFSNSFCNFVGVSHIPSKQPGMTKHPLNPTTPHSFVTRPSTVPLSPKTIKSKEKTQGIITNPLGVVKSNHLPHRIGPRGY